MIARRAVYTTAAKYVRRWQHRSVGIAARTEPDRRTDDEDRQNEPAPAQRETRLRHQ